MGMTMSEKILASHAGLPCVAPGDTITCKVDWTVCHDMFFNVDGQDLYKELDHLDHPERCLVLLDHSAPHVLPVILLCCAGAAAVLIAALVLQRKKKRKTIPA